MTDTSKTYRFDKSLWFTHLHPIYLANGEDGNQYYARLAKGESTINQKKQSEFAKPYRFVVNGELKTVTDKLEQEWLENNPDYGKRIFEHNVAKIHEDNWKEIDFTSDIIVRVKTITESELRGLAYRMFGSKALSMILPELKAMVVAKVNEDAKEVNDLLDEKIENDFALIGVAMAKEIIYEARGGNEVKFSDTDEVIVTVRANERPIDALASFLQTGQGKEIKKIIFQKLSPVVVDEIVENQAEETKKAGRPAKA